MGKNSRRVEAMMMVESRALKSNPSFSVMPMTMRIKGDKNG